MSIARIKRDFDTEIERIGIARYELRGKAHRLGGQRVFAARMAQLRGTDIQLEARIVWQRTIADSLESVDQRAAVKRAGAVLYLRGEPQQDFDRHVVGSRQMRRRVQGRARAAGLVVAQTSDA